MVGMIIGLVTVVGLIGVTVFFVITGKEYVTKFETQLKAHEQQIQTNKKDIYYKSEKSDVNVLSCNLLSLERRFQNFEDEIKQNQNVTYIVDPALKDAFDNLKKEYESLKNDVEHNKKSIDAIDDFVAVTV